MAMTAKGNMSDLDVDELAGPEDADHPERDGPVEEDLPEGLVEEGADVTRVHGVDEEADGDGKDRDHCGADAALGGERVGLAADPGPGDHGVGHDVEELGEVAADLSLDPDGGDHPFEIVAADPLGDLGQRVDEGTPQPGLG